MTPEQLRDMYQVLYARRDALAAEEAAIEALSMALDAYGTLRGWPVFDIVEAADSASVLETDGDQAGVSAGAAQAGSSGSPVPPIQQPAVSVEDAAGDQATSGEQGARVVRPVVPATIPTSPGIDPLYACIEHVLTFKTPQGLGAHRRRHHAKKPSAASLLPARDRPALSPAKPDREPGNLAMGTRRATPGGRLAARDASRTRAPSVNRGAPAPAAGITRTANVSGPPVIRKGGEQWLCNRCQEPFKTREARDLHQGYHPPIPTPSVGQRDATSPDEAAARISRGGG